jgi:copper chaperone CopZ
MIRRQFVQLVAALGATGVTALATTDATRTETVTYVVKGFSCVTCAVGLDTMLQKQKGVSWSKSTYPDGIVKIEFDPRDIKEESLKAFISEMGFRVERAK